MLSFVFGDYWLLFREVDASGIVKNINIKIYN